MTTSDYDFFAALVIGLLSAGHCFGMCGGIVGAFSANLPLHHRASPRHNIIYMLSYNLGRITSYVIAGALIGFSVGYFALKSSAFLYGLKAFSGVMLIAIGLYIANWLNIIRQTEKIGKFFWPLISPFASKFLPFHSPLSALPFGFIWGWLPCGLVYSTLTWSAAAGSASGGALIMFGFGLGTLPAMLSMGFFSQYLKTFMNNYLVRISCALLVIVYGASLFYDSIIKFL